MRMGANTQMGARAGEALDRWRNVSISRPRYRRTEDHDIEVLGRSHAQNLYDVDMRGKEIL